jgi:predicted RNase H-like HicB family nuclease
MSRYELIVYWSDVDEAYLVEVPELPGCMAEGRTFREAIANAEAKIAEWLGAKRERSHIKQSRRYTFEQGA